MVNKKLLAKHHHEDPAVWIKHFKEQSMGVKHPMQDGYTFVHNQVGKGFKRLIPIRLVSPVQQVVDQAKAEIKRERSGINRTRKRPMPQSRKRPSTGKSSASNSKRTKRNPKAKPKRVTKKKSATKKKKAPRDIFNL